MESYFKIPVRYVNQFEMHEDNPNVHYTPEVIEHHNQGNYADRLTDWMVGKSILQHLPERVDIDYLPERDEHGYFGDNPSTTRKIPTRRKSNRR